jgi:hypothetical protein
MSRVQLPFRGAGVCEIIVLLGRDSAKGAAEFTINRPVQLEG